MLHVIEIMNDHFFYHQVIYKMFESINDEKQWWGIPFVSDFLMHSNLGSVLKSSVGSENVNVNQFVQFAFKQLSSFDFNSIQSSQSSNESENDPKTLGENSTVNYEEQHVDESEKIEGLIKKENKENNIDAIFSNENEINESPQSYVDFWNNLTNSINQTIFQKLNISFSDSVRLDGIDLINKMSQSFQRSAEEMYIQSGLVTLDGRNDDCTCNNSEESSISNGYSLDIKKASQDVLSQTENILGALMILDTPFSQKDQVASSVVKEGKLVSSEMENGTPNATGSISEKSEREKMKEEDVKSLFSTAESAMEAWTMLASSLGQTSFIKSDFVKICFLDHESTDTQASCV